MSYRPTGEDGLTDHERIRHLAIQQTREQACPDRIAEAEQIAAFILGPEGRKPFPQQQLTELYELVHDMVPNNPGWTTAETVVEVKLQDLLTVFRELARFTEEPPF